MRAIINVSDKTGVADFAGGLVKLGITAIIQSGGSIRDQDSRDEMPPTSTISRWR